MIMTMQESSKSLRTRLAGLCALFLMAGLLPQSMAQQVVYKMDFERERGFNDQGFSGGYFVGPIAGGEGSFVLTTGKGSSLEVVVINSGAKIFRAVTDKKEVRWVVQAQVGETSAPTPPPADGGDDDGGDGDDGGTDTTAPAASTGAFLAVGKGNFNATFRTPLITLDTAIARELKGDVISASSAALDEDFKKVGFVAMSKWRLNWAEKETNEVNRQGLDLAGASAYLVGLFDPGDGGGPPPPVIIAPPSINSTFLVAGTVGVLYTWDVGVSGGLPPLTLTATGLPTGITLSGNRISGTANTSGRFPVTFTVRDSQNPSRSSSRTLTLDIFMNIFANPPGVPNEQVLANGNLNAPYPPVTFAAQGNVGVVTFTQGAGSILPPGMTFAGGVLSGTPTEARSFILVVSASDAGTPLEPRTKNYTFTIVP
jgi:hypothetical protein